MNRKIQDFIQTIKKNRDRLEEALNEYNEDPLFIRNIMAEKGVELTPSQLSETVDILKQILDKSDNE